MKYTAAWNYFESHEDDLYHNIYKYMNEEHTEVLSTQEGIDRVNQGYGKKSKGQTGGHIFYLLIVFLGTIQKTLLK